MRYLILLMLVSNFTFAQTTAIPDANFEQKLINLGYDTVLDGQVLTSNINTIQTLIMPGIGISNLTGIEDFTALKYLDISSNNTLNWIDITQNTALETLLSSGTNFSSINVTQNASLIELDVSYNDLSSLNVSQNTNLQILNCSLNKYNFTSLDVSQNSALIELYCGNNSNLNNLVLSGASSLLKLWCYNHNMTSLDVTQNTSLVELVCDNGNLASLDVSQNTALIYLNCYGNNISSIDVSQNVSLQKLDCKLNPLGKLNLTNNPSLIELDCQANQLTCLNIKNGNNSNLQLFKTYQNPNLFCIEADNTQWTSINLTDIDPWTTFNTNCTNPCVVGIQEKSLPNVSIYPNPTTGKITIDLDEVKQNIKATLTNSIGQVIFVKQYKSINYINLDIDTPKGIYFLKLITTDGETKTIKILKE